jgi:uncharacterized protein
MMPERGYVDITACVDSGALPLVELALRLPEGATVADACNALNADFPNLVVDQVCGIWGQVVSRDAVLKNGDRVELYRPLIADPKATRRRRALETPPTNAPEGRSIYARGNKKRRVGTKPKAP